MVAAGNCPSVSTGEGKLAPVEHGPTEVPAEPCSRASLYQECATENMTRTEVYWQDWEDKS